MEYEDDYDEDDEEEEADFPGSEGDDDDDETARALRYMYNIAHGYPLFFFLHFKCVFDK